MKGRYKNMTFIISGERFNEDAAKVYLLYLLQGNCEIPTCDVVDGDKKVVSKKLDDIFNDYYD